MEESWRGIRKESVGGRRQQLMLEESCMVEFGATPNDSTGGAMDAWMEVEAQAADCGPRVELCGAKAVERPTQVACDAVAGYLDVDVLSDVAACRRGSGADGIEGPRQRVAFVFSFQRGGFCAVSADASATNDDQPERNVDDANAWFETLHSLLCARVPGYQQRFEADVAHALSLATTEVDS